MSKIFPDINIAKQHLRDRYDNFAKDKEKELLEELPNRMQRNIERGAYFLDHIVTSMCSKHKTSKYIEAVLAVEDKLKEEGFDVKSFLSEHNPVYHKIEMLICWDIETVKNDTLLYEHYYRSINDKSKLITKDMLLTKDIFN